MALKKQSLYNTFGDKHAMYLQALKLNHRLMIQDRAALLQQLEHDGAAPLEALAELFSRGLFDQTVENQLFNNAVAEFAATDPEVTAEVERYFADSQNLFATIILKGQADLTITADQSSSDLAATLLEGRIGLQVKLRQGCPVVLIKKRSHSLLDLLRA